MDQFRVLEELKSIIEAPTLYVCHYFTDLRTVIDIDFALISFKGQNKQENKKIWIELINKLNEIEIRCLKKVSTNGFIKELEDETKQLIAGIHQTADLESQVTKLQKMLFLNQTIIYLQKNKCNSVLLNENLQNKLIVVKNTFFTKKEIDLLKNG